MSHFGGRQIDDIALWSEYVEFPPNFDRSDQYLPKGVCPNPNHDTNKRHFQVNQRDGLVHCFAYCGISGNYLHALCVIHDFYGKFKVEETDDKRERSKRLRRAHRSARKILLGHSRLGRGTSPVSFKRRSPRSDGAVSKKELEYKSYIPEAGLTYLAERRVVAESIAKWEIGWDAEELRIVIPARDLNGRVRFLIKRAMKERQQPKYLYTEGFPKTCLLFGACNVDRALVASFGAVLVEGSFDTIGMHGKGWANTVGTLGTGISQEQVEILARLRPSRIFLFFDRDSAGVHGIEIAERRLKGKYPLFVCRYPKGKSDPDEMTRKEVGRSLERAITLREFKRLVNNTKVRV